MLEATFSIESHSTLSQPIDSEVELIRLVAKSDKRAFEELFRLYHKRIYKFSIRMLQDNLLADEVACETLYIIWNTASKFREKSKVSTWILGIAYRRSLKSYNKNARHTHKRDPEDQLQELPELSPDVNPETFTNNAMEVNQVQAALSSLSSDHRAVIELTALGYSVTEIADIVGCPKNTVKTRTFHARRQLKTTLEG